MDSLGDPLWQILRDPLWQFIGVIGTFIVWFVTQRSSRTNKSIIFTILAQKLLMYKAAMIPRATDLLNAWQEILQKTSDETEKELINNFFKQLMKYILLISRYAMLVTSLSDLLTTKCQLNSNLKQDYYMLK